MSYVSSRLNNLFLSVIFAFSLSACLTDSDKKVVFDSFHPPVVPDPVNDRVDSRLCVNERTIQPAAEVSRKIDLLFVVDTSGSISEERGKIAEGIDGFVAALPSDVDFQVGVVLGHGSKSLHAGKLYSYGSNAKVLSSQTMSLDLIRSQLKANMQKSPGDYYSDGGEMMMYSLMRAFSSEYTWNQSLGFFRDDAALAVVFVTDENDICSLDSYPQGVLPVVDPDNLERPSFNRDCSGVNPNAVLDMVNNKKPGVPTLFTGIVYTNPATTPAVGENEVAYGIVETIALDQGIAIDLATGQYDAGLAQIGFLAIKRLDLITEFPLKRNDFDVKTLRVEVDRTRVPFTYDAATNVVHIDELLAGTEKSEVYISYCLPIKITIDVINPRVSEIGSGSAIIEWSTSMLATGEVHVKNLKTLETFTVTESTVEIADHQVELFPLSPKTDYELTIHSTKMLGGQLVTGQFIFYIKTP